MAQKRISLVFTAAAAALLALSVIVVWKTTHGSSSEPPFVGKWKYISGQVKAGPGFPIRGKAAPDGTSEMPLAGKSGVVEQRNGTLWYVDEDGNCRYELRTTGGRAELVPGGKTECETNDTGTASRATTVRMSMAIDSQGQAHISGAARASWDVKGERRNIDFTYDGVAVRDVPPAK